MQIKSPCIITARLLPGIKVNDSSLSIEYNGVSPEGRDRYLVYLDTPQGEYEIDDLASGCQGGSLQEGLESCLGFMGACAESLEYEQRTGRKGDNADLFVPEVAQWCIDNKDEIDMLQCILSEEKDLIEE